MRATFSKVNNNILKVQQQLKIAKHNNSTLLRERDITGLENNRLTKDNAALRQQATHDATELTVLNVKAAQLEAVVTSLQQPKSKQLTTITRLESELARHNTTFAPGLRSTAPP